MPYTNTQTSWPYKNIYYNKPLQYIKLDIT